MKVAAITLTYNRLDLTKRTIKSFYSKTDVNYHLFVDNNSKDGTVEWLSNKNRILFAKNKGISYAFATAIKSIPECDFVLKLDNDVEVITENIINYICKFYKDCGQNFVVSPRDLSMDPNYLPVLIEQSKYNGCDIDFVSHTGGAFQIMPYKLALKYANEINIPKGDLNRGIYFQLQGYRPVYLNNLFIRHIGGTERKKFKYIY